MKPLHCLALPIPAPPSRAVHCNTVPLRASPRSSKSYQTNALAFVITQNLDDGEWVKPLPCNSLQRMAPPRRSQPCSANTLATKPSCFRILHHAVLTRSRIREAIALPCIALPSHAMPCKALQGLANPRSAQLGIAPFAFVPQIAIFRWRSALREALALPCIAWPSPAGHCRSRPCIASQCNA